MASRYAELICKTVFGSFEISFCRDHPERTLNDCGFPLPGRRQWCGFRTTTQTWPITGFFSSGRTREELHIFPSGFCRANRPAVDAGGFDANKEFAIKPAVASEHRLIENVLVHDGTNLAEVR